MGKGLAGESSQWRKPGDPLASTEKVESITRGGTVKVSRRPEAEEPEGLTEGMALGQSA